jgi:hypothetical protein
MADQPAATAGGPGPEPCRDCRAPLVPGQRYCLYCGTRVPDARLAFLDVLVQDVAGVGAAPATAAATVPVLAGASGQEPGVNGWLRRHTPVLALTGLILGTLLIGLLIGHWATDRSSDAAPQRAAAQPAITVQSAAPAAAAVAAPAAGSGGDAGAAAAGTGADSAAGSAKRGGSAKAAKQDAAKDGGSATTAKTPSNAVSTKALSTLSGQDKEKAIEKAAKKGQPIATGDGKLPPKDDKAPAGGAGFETIG